MGLTPLTALFSIGPVEKKLISPVLLYIEFQIPQLWLAWPRSLRNLALAALQSDLYSNIPTYGIMRGRNDCKLPLNLYTSLDLHDGCNKTKWKKSDC
ncbi:hypothetical protein, partial [Paenibacillus graminis]|uniref:hypothetical protein n=1 Tax=Paenibacillus graminis TaxID=189425 RepID=UPI0030CA0EA1